MFTEMLLDAWFESESSEALKLGLRKITPSTRSTLYTKKIKGCSYAEGPRDSGRGGAEIQKVNNK